MILPTVKIIADTERGWVIINKSDFDPDQHEVFDGGAVALDLTPEGIDDMAKPDVIEMLEAHGVSPDGRRGVDFLRDELKKVVFVDLDS